MRLGKRGKHLLKLCRYSVDIRGLGMYYWPEVQLAYLVDFVYILLFCTQSCSLTLFGIIFFLKNTFEFFSPYLVLYLWLEGSQEA